MERKKCCVSCYKYQGVVYYYKELATWTWGEATIDLNKAEMVCYGSCQGAVTGSREMNIRLTLKVLSFGEKILTLSNNKKRG